MTILDSTYACNRCGREMKHRDAKTGMWEWDGEKSIRLDIHICEDCRSDVIDYVNDRKKSNIFYNNTTASNTGLFVPKPKKHPFYGNQYILPNRKSRK